MMESKQLDRGAERALLEEVRPLVVALAQRYGELFAKLPQAMQQQVVATAELLLKHQVELALQGLPVEPGMLLAVGALVKIFPAFDPQVEAAGLSQEKKRTVDEVLDRMGGLKRDGLKEDYGDQAMKATREASFTGSRLLPSEVRP